MPTMVPVTAEVLESSFYLYNALMKIIKDPIYIALENSKDRLNYVLFRTSTFLSTYIKLPPIAPKSAEFSTTFRNEGNRYFKLPGAENLEKAFEEYTKSVAYAPRGSLELALAYANRSAVLFKSNLLSDCLKDIAHALDNPYPDNLKAKLYLRRANCLRVLTPNDVPAMDEALAETYKWLDKMDEQKREAMEKLVIEGQEIPSGPMMTQLNLGFNDVDLKLETENPLVPGLSGAVDLKYDEEHGRHLVARRDIEPDEILISGKLYTRIICQPMRYKVCWHCAKQTWSSLPCDSCGEVVFCSEICKNSAWLDYHSIECPVVRQLIPYEAVSTITSLRLTIMALKEAGSLENLMNYLIGIDNSTDKLTKGFIDGKLQPDQYPSVYGLCLINPQDHLAILKFLIYGLLVGCFLAQQHEIIGERLPEKIDLLKDNDRFISLIDLIIKNNWIDYCNNVVSKVPGSNARYSQTIVPAFGLFSRPPAGTNVRHGFQKDNVVFKSINEIKKGEIIYGFRRLWFMDDESISPQLRNLYS